MGLFDTGVAAPAAAKVLRMVTTAQGSLVYDKLLEGSNDPVIRVFSCGVVLRQSGELFDLASKRKIGAATSRECEVVRKNGGWLVADWQQDELVYAYINGTSLQEERLSCTLKGQKLVAYEDRLFSVTERGLTELSLRILGRTILSPGQTWGAQVNSTVWFDGVGIQNSMGAKFVIAPFGDNAASQVRVKELDGLKVVAAKAGNRFVAIMTVNKAGEYQKLELTFDRGYKSYAVWQGGAERPDLNMTMLPKGVMATVIEDGELNIYVPTNGNLNKVSDKDITTEMLLGNWGDKVVFIRDGSVWSLAMRK